MAKLNCAEIAGVVLGGFLAANGIAVVAMAFTVYNHYETYLKINRSLPTN